MATGKFNRTFTLQVQDKPSATFTPIGNVPYQTAKDPIHNQTVYVTEAQEAIEIKDPLTIEFDINRMIGVGSNNATIRLYNLAEKTRARLTKDRIDLQDAGTGQSFRKVILTAGYKTGGSGTIFIGSLLQGYSERVGNNMVTTLYCVDGGYGIYNSYSNETFEAGVSKQVVIDRLIKKMEETGIERGAITPIDGTHKLGYTATGDTFTLLSEGGFIFIDANKLNILKIDEYIPTGNIQIISSATGLLGTPKRSDNFIEITMIFEPRLFLGTLVEVQSDTDKRFNGVYKINGINHKGIISGSVNGPLTTTLQLFTGDLTTNVFKAIQPS